jgi:site-specific DNA-cytosine methylase
MKQVAKLKGTNGLSVVSTFSGAGGSCLGFEMAGFEILWASEFVEAAREVYEANHPGVHVDDRDIRDVSGDDILQAIGREKGDVDVLEGSPPCASFSMVGKRDKAWGKVSEYSDTHQRTDDLFFEFSRLVGEIQPRVFVAENVAGLVQGAAKGYFKIILSHLKSNPHQLRLEGDGGGPYTGTGRHVSVGSRVRWGEIRDIRMEELRRLCGFPDDFKLSGTYRQQWERLGRAVPSPMSRAIAETIRDQILCP